MGTGLVGPTEVNVYQTMHYHTPSQSAAAAETFQDIVSRFAVEQVRAEAKAKGDPSGSARDPSEPKEPKDKNEGDKNETEEKKEKANEAGGRLPR